MEKSTEVMAKLEAYKEKLVKMQMKVVQIEKKCKYKDSEHFGFYKPMIERAFEELEFSFICCEAQLENLQKLVEDDEYLGSVDLEKLEAEELKYSEGFIKPKFKKAAELINKSMDGVDWYD